MHKEYMMESYKLEDIEEREIIPGYHGRFIHSPNMTVAFWNVEAGSSIPEHTHPHEQIMSLLEGQFEFVVDGENAVHAPGSVVVIPPHAPHKGKALTACKIMDVFYPVRDDYL